MLTNWDKQALITLIQAKEEKDKVAYAAALEENRPDPEDAHAPASIAELKAQPAHWLSMFGGLSGMLARPVRFIQESIAMLSTADTISAYPALGPELNAGDTAVNL